MISVENDLFESSVLSLTFLLESSAKYEKIVKIRQSPF